MIDEYYTWLIYGYHIDDLTPGSGKRVVAVCDECGLYRSLQMRKYSDICIRCIDKTQLHKRDPLPDGWQSKLSDITTNKESSVYLGSIAEVILSRIYDDVQVMPYGNHGYDIICNREKMIDIKSCATGDNLGYWMFTIKKNKITDYFLCIAFDNRNDLYNPAHLWMIPSHVVNHLVGLKISKSTIDKWQQYELPLDKLQTCCKSLKHD